jgi:hypothetical protein
MRLCPVAMGAFEAVWLRKRMLGAMAMGSQRSAARAAGSLRFNGARPSFFRFHVRFVVCLSVCHLSLARSSGSKNPDFDRVTLGYPDLN